MPLVIDICCGRGGWSNGFLAEGWEARGYDLQPQPEYKGRFVQCDLLDLVPFDLRDADALVVSTPCEQFSVHCMKHFHPNPPPPLLGVKLFSYAQSLCIKSGRPYVMENVRCAERFVGRAVNHCGPFYLWGNAVPAIFPPECYGVVKGIDVGSSAMVKGMTPEEKRVYRGQFKWNQAWGNSKQRQRDTAAAATVPLVVAQYVAQQLGKLVLHG